MDSATTPGHNRKVSAVEIENEHGALPTPLFFNNVVYISSGVFFFLRFPFMFLSGTCSVLIRSIWPYISSLQPEMWVTNGKIRATTTTNHHNNFLTHYYLPTLTRVIFGPFPFTSGEKRKLTKVNFGLLLRTLQVVFVLNRVSSISLSSLV